jgi:dTDP-4-amino-4,6-dideoxygalactose transaminase
MQPVFADATFYGDGTSEKLFEDGLCLPSGSNLTDADLDRVVGAIKVVLES